MHACTHLVVRGGHEGHLGDHRAVLLPADLQLQLRAGLVKALLHIAA